MSILIKTPEEIEKMRLAGRLAATVFDRLDSEVKPGVSTEKLNQIAHQYITETLKSIPAPLNYHGFPKSICTSINHVVCHGIPSDKVKLKNGDIINLDITIIKDGYHADTSKMYLVGRKTPSYAKHLVEITQHCLYEAIKQVKPEVPLGIIGATIEKIAKQEGFSVVQNYCGHGIGKGFHEAPQVLHYGKGTEGPILKEGMIFTIEPMINQGTHKNFQLSDNWTVITADKKLSAQWEHTILVTPNGYEVLTLRDEEKGLI